jgi:sulfite oxidase
MRAIHVKYSVWRLSQVAKHKTKQDGIWVTYKDGVYDITDFVEGHPGGSARIMMAAGAASPVAMC